MRIEDRSRVALMLWHTNMLPLPLAQSHCIPFCLSLLSPLGYATQRSPPSLTCNRKKAAQFFRPARTYHPPSTSILTSACFTTLHLPLPILSPSFSTSHLWHTTTQHPVPHPHP